MQNFQRSKASKTLKRCEWGLCNGDSRYADRDYMQGVYFIPFPKPKKDIDKVERWVTLCNRLNFTPANISTKSFVCNTHFIGGHGPSEKYPDPILATPQNSVMRNNRGQRRLAITTISNLSEGVIDFSQFSLFDLSTEPISTALVYTEPSKFLESGNTDSTICDNLEEPNDCLTENNSNPSSLETQQKAAEKRPVTIWLCGDQTNVPLNPNTINNDLKNSILTNQIRKEIRLDKLPPLWAPCFDDSNFTIFKMQFNKIVIRFLISEELQVDVFVLNHKLASTHPLTTQLLASVSSVSQIYNCIELLDTWNVCIGNAEDTYLVLYHKQDLRNCELFNETNSLHGGKCELLLPQGTKATRCKSCQLLRIRCRNIMWKQQKRNKDILPISTNIKFMKQSEFRKRLKLQQTKRIALQRKVNILQMRVKRLLAEGHVYPKKEKDWIMVEIAQT